MQQITPLQDIHDGIRLHVRVGDHRNRFMPLRIERFAARIDRRDAIPCKRRQEKFVAQGKYLSDRSSSLSLQSTGRLHSLLKAVEKRRHFAQQSLNAIFVRVFHISLIATAQVVHFSLRAQHLIFERSDLCLGCSKRWITGLFQCWGLRCFALAQLIRRLILVDISGLFRHACAIKFQDSGNMGAAGRRFNPCSGKKDDRYQA